MPRLAGLLADRIESHFDAVPRARGEVQEVGPFSLGLYEYSATPWTSAWPRYGLRDDVSATEVRAIMQLQQQITGKSGSLSWVHEFQPGLTAAAEEAGLTITRNPLMVLGEAHADRYPPDPSLVTTMMAPRSPRVLEALGAVDAGFAGSDEVVPGDPKGLVPLVEDGRTRLLGAYLDGRPVGGGFHNPVGETTELVGVSVIPSARGRGVAARIVLHLTADAIAAGIRTLWLSATDDRVAGVYARVGYEVCGTYCSARRP